LSRDHWDDPDIWISGMNPVTDPVHLAWIIAARTSAMVADVLRAMAAATTAPEAPELLELADRAVASGS
jgi:hypothetical protein